jgi:hypothetical protein
LPTERGTEEADFGLALLGIILRHGLEAQLGSGCSWRAMASASSSKVSSPALPMLAWPAQKALWRALQRARRHAQPKLPVNL